MAIRYKALTELYQETQRSVTAPDQWRAFLASACRNYRLPFDEQLLVYAQRPDATAVLEIERWNRQFGRWVNRGANGIAVFDGEHNGKPRLKYYFDISDTHEARFPRPVPLWTVREEYAPDIIETLENSFGELEHKEDLGEALLSVAKNAVEDNMPDYLSELKTLTEGSFLEELDDLNLEVEYRRAVKNSIGYMLLVRCGLDPSDYFEDEDFRDVLNFNTPQTLNALGVAAGDISQMCLSAISRTVLALQRQPQKENRTFEPQQKNQYAVTEQEHAQPERSFEYDRDTMTNEEWNTRLYEKMFAEQEQFRDWLLSQPPAEILNHAYEYTMREDILMSLEYNDLEDSQARALLKSGKPLKQIFERWENKETSHMENVWDTVQEQAKAAEAKQKAKAQKER